MSSAVPEGWVEEKLGALVTSHNSGIYKKKEFYGEGFNIAGVSDLYGSVFIDGQEYRRVPLSEAEKNKHTLKEHDLLYGESSLVRSGIARTVCTTKRGEGTAFAWHTRRLEIDQSKAFSPFLVYLLEEADTRLKVEAVATQTALTGMTTKDYFGVGLRLPPLPEQKKIASILTSVDEVIEKTESQIAKLQDLKTGMMQELLTKGIGHTKFKDSPVGKIPVGWDVVKVSDVVNVIDSLHQTPSFSSSGYPMARVTDIKTGKLSLANANLVNREVYEEFIKKYRPQMGDVVMSRVGSYGVCSYVNTGEEFCIGQNTVVINPHDINSKFLYYSLNSQSTQTQVEYEVAGSGYKSLSLASIRALKLSIPPIPEQERIGKILWEMDNDIEKRSQKTNHLLSLKKALMQDLLTGKVRVKTD